MHKINLSEGKTYYYNSTWRALYEDEEQTKIVKNRFLSEEDLILFKKQKNLIHDNLVASKDNSDKA